MDIPAAQCIDKPIPACRDDEYREVAWGITEKGGKFAPIWINRPKPTGEFVKFEITHCGICHSDCHLGSNECCFIPSIFPMVPGHELVGVVTEVGDKVTKVKVGDNIGVGTLVDACLDCSMCLEDKEEQYCEMDGYTHTYNTMKGQYGEKSHFLGNPDTQNFGGYSASHVVHQHFAMKIPDGVPMEKAGPILCAGITMFDPLVHWGALDAMSKGKVMTIGIVGIGGLGTMGMKFAKAMGHKVMAISRDAKKEQICKDKGADFFVCSSDPESFKAGENKCDIILDTVPVNHGAPANIPLLRTNGTLVCLGLIDGTW